MAHSSDDIRNLALFGHVNTGKTALVDAIAHETNVASRQGDSADGTSISNTEPEEKERKQTLSSHVFRFPLGDCQLNLIDTPGHSDFQADAISSMSVVDTGVLCISAASGLTFHSRQLWSHMRDANLARAIVVTHVDGDNVDFDETLAELQDALGDIVVPVTYPDASGPSCSKVYDVLAGEGDQAAAYRESLEERIAEADDSILEAYLESGELSAEDVDEHFGTALALGKLVPLFVVVPPKKLGLDRLCDYIAKKLPSPVAFGARGACLPDGDAPDQTVPADPDGAFAANVFKVVVDPYVGRLSYARCFRGKLSAEDTFLHVRTGKQEKAGGLLGLKGAETEPATVVITGDIFAVAKLEDLDLNDTITADGAALKFPMPAYPPPCFSLAVLPASRGDETKINQGLEKLSAEDPTFQTGRDATTGELIVSGMSPLHLELQLTRLERRYGVKTENHKPKVPYKETVRSPADGHHRHKKQSGGKGQFAEVYMRIKPRVSGEGFEFIDSIVGGSIPRQFIPEIEKGIRRFLQKGGLAGCEVVDVAAEIYDGKFHDVDSDQISFQLAGERGFLDAFEKAKPVLLEPIMDVQIRVPERFTGDVAGSLSSLRGRMAGMEMIDGIQVIEAQVPLKEMQDYATQLRSITAGEGTFTMRPASYEQVPANLQQEIVSAYKKAQETR